MRRDLGNRLLSALASGRLAIVLLTLIGVSAMLGTLIPQHAELAVYESRYSPETLAMLTRVGLTDLYGSWWFLAFLGLLAVNLIACLATRSTFWCERPDSLIRHIGFVVVLLGGAVSGLLAERGTIKLMADRPMDTVYVDREERPLGFELRLKSFTLERHDPDAEQLLVQVPGEARPRSFPVAPGQEMLVTGTPYRLQIERVVPDFAMDMRTRDVVSRSPEPRNPAIQVRVDDGKAVETRWVFANPSGMHAPRTPLQLAYQWRPSHPKSFRSAVEVREGGTVVDEWVLEVNHPVRYRGRTFYQQSYDPERWAWSGILAMRDPGIGIVYTGFGVVVLGLVYGAATRRRGSRG